jgi:hypothetical protein
MYRAGEKSLSLWRAAAVAALLTILVALSFGLVPGINACGTEASWIAFQKVGSPAAVAKLICDQPAFVAALRKSMWLDALVFIPVYATMLGLAFGALRPVPRPIWLLGVAALTIGIIADQVEGFRLLAILDALPGTQAMTDAVNAATLGKKLGLSLITLLIGLLLARDSGPMRAFGAFIALGGLAAAIASFGSALGAYRALINQYGLLIAWLALAIVTSIKGFRPARAG